MFLKMWQELKMQTEINKKPHTTKSTHSLKLEHAWCYLQCDSLWGYRHSKNQPITVDVKISQSKSLLLGWESCEEKNWDGKTRNGVERYI